MKTIWCQLSPWPTEVKGPQPALSARLLPAGQAACEDTYLHAEPKDTALDSTDLDLNPDVTTWWLCNVGRLFYSLNLHSLTSKVTIMIIPSLGGRHADGTHTVNLPVWWGAQQPLGLVRGADSARPSD